MSITKHPYELIGGSH